MKSTMSQAELRYLEGEAALKDRIFELSGRAPNSAQTSFVSSCLLHGRMFWESAATAPLETRPLLLYYGSAAFAKALVLATTGRRLQDLSQSHGLSCKVGDGELIAGFTMQAKGEGLFQEFNDAVAVRNRLVYLDEHGQRAIHVTPTAMASRLTSFEVSLLDCFSRVPGIGTPFKLCTGQEQHLTPIWFGDSHMGQSRKSIQVSSSRRLDGRDSLIEIVAEIRAQAPFLVRWQLGEATFHYGTTTLTFIDLEAPADELLHMADGNGHFVLGAAAQGARFDALASLPPLTGGYGGGLQHVGYVQPFGDLDVSEFSLIFAALLGLSSLVRYHPHTWTACVHRRRLAGRPVDDALLPVIEAFLEVVGQRVPSLVAEILLGR